MWWLPLITVWFAATAWARPLLLPDEGRYVGVAWEMLHSGDWLTPRLDGLPFFHKPPLFYWITAAAMTLFGANEWAARLASVLGATAGAFALALFVRRWLDARSARATLVVLLTQPLFFLGAQFANLDMLVAGCISATTLLFAHVALCVSEGRQARRALVLGYGFAALGVLAKGLIGAVLPGLVLLAWLAAWRRPRLILALLWWPGMLLFAALSSPWFIAMQLRYPDFLDYFFVVQHFKRFAQGGFNNVQPFWFYPVVLLLLGLPWSAWLRGIARRSYWRDPVRGPVRLLMGVWLLAVVVFFSLPGSKLVGYVLPAVPPLSFLVADAALLALDGAARWRRWWQMSAGLALLACLVTVTALSLRPPRSNKGLAQALAAAQAPGEPVIFINEYFYDLPFYARQRSTAWVVDAWGSDEIDRRDNWRKELADAARFASPGAAAVLVTPDALAQRLCLAPVAWVVAPRWAVPAFAFLGGGVEVAGNPRAALWKIESALPATASALGCPGKPSGGPASR